MLLARTNSLDNNGPAESDNKSNNESATISQAIIPAVTDAQSSDNSNSHLNNTSNNASVEIDGRCNSIYCTPNLPTTRTNQQLRVLPRKRLRSLNVSTESPGCSKTLKWSSTNDTPDVPDLTAVGEAKVTEHQVNVTRPQAEPKGATIIEAKTEAKVEHQAQQQQVVASTTAIATNKSAKPISNKRKCSIQIYADSSEEDLDSKQNNSKFYDTTTSNKTDKQPAAIVWHPKAKLTSWLANENKTPSIRVEQANSIIGITEYHQMYKQEQQDRINNNNSNKNVGDEFDLWSNLK